MIGNKLIFLVFPFSTKKGELVLDLQNYAAEGKKDVVANLIRTIPRKLETIGTIRFTIQPGWGKKAKHEPAQNVNSSPGVNKALHSSAIFNPAKVEDMYTFGKTLGR